MRRFGGQAVRHVLGGIVALLFLLGIAVGALAWMLSAHPISVPWLAQRIEHEADAALGPGSVTIGGATIAWDGFHAGQGSPFGVRLDKVVVHLPGAREIDAAYVRIRLDLLPLLHGIVRPDSVRIEHVRIAVPPLSAPSASDLRSLLKARGPPLRQPPWVKSIHLLAIDGAELFVGRRKLLSHLDAALARQGDGGLRLQMRFDLRPADLAALTPGLAAAAGRLDAPVSARAGAAFDPNGRPLSANLLLRAAPGHIALAAAPVDLRKLALSAAWSRKGGFAGKLDLVVQPDPAAPATHLTADARAKFPVGAGRITATGSAHFDRMQLADLPRLWPAGLAPDARAWLTGNITAGTANDLNATFAASVLPDGTGARIDRLSGTLSASDLTVHWLRPIPPVRHGGATVHFLGPDRIGIDFAAGEQPVPGLSEPLHVQSGHMTIAGLTAREQTADIQVRISGSVPAAIGLLSAPRLHLLADHPIALHGPVGEVTAEIGVRLPLNKDDTIEQVHIAASARLAHAGLQKVVAGQALRDGTVELTADNNGLAFAGAGTLAGIPGQFTGTMDFGAGPPTQVQERIKAHAITTIAALRRLGLDSAGIAVGKTNIDAIYRQSRDGAETVALQADLKDAELRVEALDWRKPVGEQAHLDAQLVLDRGGHIGRIEAIDGAGAGFAVRGSAHLGPHGAATFTLARLVLGQTEAHGTVTLRDGGADVAANLAGPVIDLGPRLPTLGQNEPAPERGAWNVTLHFARALLAHDRPVTDFVMQGSGFGGRMQRLSLQAATGRGALVRASITPGKDGRAVRIDAADGGALLHDLGVLEDVEGGKLNIAARYQDARPGHPLSGKATLDDFRLRGAHLLGKALQAASLYGLVQALSGPGMGFTHLAAPFTLKGGVITLAQARAFNPSLGLTAQGTIDIAHDRLDLRGTIVPAYYLNTALGRLPLIGRLFSPEKGGGVIAADYAARGSLSDPAVTVNPLSALAPGFLRELFKSSGK